MAIQLENYDPPIKPYLDVLYEDSDFIIINKQAGLLSVPGKPLEHKDCVEYRARMQFGWVKVAHRLDLDTSGLMIVARNEKAHAHLSKQFEKRVVKKTYEALLFGRLENDEGEIDLPLVCDWPNRPKQMVCFETGRPSQTHYKVLERLDDRTRVLFTPLTGRSHQLRVHALALGHPIIGDRLYADGAALSLSPRLALHATSIEFSHPSEKTPMHFESPAPF